MKLEREFCPSVLNRLWCQVAYDDQDITLVVTSPTSSKARVAQDATLVVASPTTSKARLDQDVILVVAQNILQVVVPIKYIRAIKARAYYHKKTHTITKTRSGGGVRKFYVSFVVT